MQYVEALQRFEFDQALEERRFFNVMHLISSFNYREKQFRVLWMFGCLLCDMLIYTIYGSHELSKFHDGLRTFRGRNTDSAFHSSGRLASGTMQWLEKLEAADSLVQRKLVRLIRKMLSMNPIDRPSFDELTKTLRYSAFWLVLLELQGLLSKENHSTHLQAVSIRRYLLQVVETFTEHGKNDTYPGYKDVLQDNTIFREICDASLALREELKQERMSAAVIHTHMFQIQRLLKNGNPGQLSQSPILIRDLSILKQRLLSIGQ